MSTKSHALDTNHFLRNDIRKSLLVLNVILAVAYFLMIAFYFERGNTILFWLLVAGEVFHVWQAMTFIRTIWNMDHKAPFDGSIKPEVDVFITVAGEPLDIVLATARAAKAMEYPNFNVYILNDGYAAKKDNWREVEEMARSLGIRCITRKNNDGAKAGNINNGLRLSGAPFVAMFDADHVPSKDFLNKTIGYFIDPRMSFVQTPQYYKNQHFNFITQGAWDQQALFFGPICKGRNRLNAVTMCGTNMVVRRDALREVGGMCEDSIAEDFATGVFMHERGWKSYYVAEVLALGLAPEDFLSYYKQQFRWARGALDVLFTYNLLGRRGLSWSQKIEYLAAVSFFLSGIIVIMNALIPVIFFFTGQSPFVISTMLLAAIFLPYIFLTIYILQKVSNETFTFRSLAFSMATFPIHLKALWAVLTKQKTPFSITAKRRQNGNFLKLVIPHIVYIAIVAIGIGVAIAREGMNPSVASNMAWALLNAAIFSEFIFAASPLGNLFGTRSKPAAKIMTDVAVAPTTTPKLEGLSVRKI